jgi:hypothetical protein
MKKNLMLFMSVFVIFMLIVLSCDNTSTTTDLTGKSFRIYDGFHSVKFKTSNIYEIYQYSSVGTTCLGNGTWSFSNEIVTLTSNDSRCESTREIYGQFKISDSGEWLEK